MNYCLSLLRASTVPPVSGITPETVVMMRHGQPRVVQVSGSERDRRTYYNPWWGPLEDSLYGCFFDIGVALPTCVCGKCPRPFSSGQRPVPSIGADILWDGRCPFTQTKIPKVDQGPNLIPVTPLRYSFLSTPVIFTFRKSSNSVKGLPYKYDTLWRETPKFLPLPLTRYRSPDIVRRILSTSKKSKDPQ